MGRRPARGAPVRGSSWWRPGFRDFRSGGILEVVVDLVQQRPGREPRCRARVHRAQAIDLHLPRRAEAQPRAPHRGWQEGGPSGRFHRAGHRCERRSLRDILRANDRPLLLRRRDGGRERPSNSRFCYSRYQGRDPTGLVQLDPFVRDHRWRPSTERRLPWKSGQPRQAFGGRTLGPLSECKPACARDRRVRALLNYDRRGSVPVQPGRKGRELHSQAGIESRRPASGEGSCRTEYRLAIRFNSS